MGATQQRARPDKRARRVVLPEIRFVDIVEFGIQGEVGTKNLHEDEILHGHAGLAENRLHPFERVAGFLLDIIRQLAGLHIEANPTGDIERISDQHAIAERCLKDFR